ncbi:hypothetical protein D3C87_1811830 [compost metagenome]
MWGVVITPLVELLGGWLQGRKEIQQAAIQKEVQVLQNEANWDTVQAEASKASWKDEWLTILVSIPMIMAFIPGMKDEVMNGFSVLASCPEWYQYLIGVVFAASFGIKKVTDIFASQGTKR